MNWEAIGAVGEIIGAISVVLTLFYLSVQLRQNTAQVKHSALATEIAAYQDMIGRISELNALRITNPDLTDVIIKGGANFDSLSENERSRYSTWTISLLRHGDMAFLLYERGIIDYQRAISSMGPLIAAMDQEGFKRVWIRMKGTGSLTPEYVDFIESLRDKRTV